MADTKIDTSGYNGALQRIGDYSGDNPMKQNTQNYNQFGYFLQGIDVTRQGIDQMTPYVPGVSRLFMHVVPPFMQVQFPTLTKNFKSYIETGYKSVDGISDLDVEFINIEGGFAQQSFNNVSHVRDSTEEITVQLYEMSGSPVRDFIETWITGVRDPRSGIAHYHGAIASGEVDYCEKNHTAEFVYYALDPTAKKIEYACLFAHCFPTRVQKSHLNYTSGTRGEVLLDVAFKVTKYEGRYVNDLAAYYLAKDNLNYNYLDFNPYRDGGAEESISYALDLQETAGASTT
jgi:hypothetical protein